MVSTTKSIAKKCKLAHMQWKEARKSINPENKLLVEKMTVTTLETTEIDCCRADGWIIEKNKMYAKIRN